MGVVGEWVGSGGVYADGDVIASAGGRMGYIPELIIDSITIPFSSSQEISQTYRDLAARYPMRTGNGSMIIRTAWSGKVGTTLDGQGVIPVGFSAFDWSTTHTLYCVAPRAVGGTTALTINVPKARRTDGTLNGDGSPVGAIAYARAIMSYQNDWQYTTYTSADADPPLASTHHKFTLTAVAGALRYQVIYYPKITVICNPPEESVSADAMYSWSLEAEEV
jgi:hypothetical protein